MASMRDIQRRKSGIANIQQITKAMKLVATVKLQKTRRKAEQAKPYFQQMYQAVTSMLARSGNLSHPYLIDGASDKKAVILISSNRGLAGGYNSNVTRLLLTQGWDKEKLKIYAVGHRGRDILDRRGFHIHRDYSEVMNAPMYEDAKEISLEVLGEFSRGEIGEIYLVYTEFKNTVVHEAKLQKLLPVEFSTVNLHESDKHTLMNYEPDADQALDIIIPEYVTSILFGALTESAASENGARMQAMDAATNNAKDMIDTLNLQYNRARQGTITQELTEIIAGAEAIH